MSSLNLARNWKLPACRDGVVVERGRSQLLVIAGVEIVGQPRRRDLLQVAAAVVHLLHRVGVPAGTVTSYVPSALYGVPGTAPSASAAAGRPTVSPPSATSADRTSESSFLLRENPMIMRHSPFLEPICVHSKQSL